MESLIKSKFAEKVDLLGYTFTVRVLHDLLLRNMMVICLINIFRIILCIYPIILLR